MNYNQTIEITSKNVIILLKKRRKVTKFLMV